MAKCLNPRRFHHREPLGGGTRTLSFCKSPAVSYSRAKREDRMAAEASTSGAKKLVTILREHLSNAVMGGLFLMLTGFTPEHWVVRLLEAIHLPANWLKLSLGFDPRIVLVFVGVAIIAGDQVLRRRTVTHAAGIGAPTPAAMPSALAAVAPAEPPPLPDRPSIAV